MTELATGRYSTFEPAMGVPVRITVGEPKFPLRYEILHAIRRLAPWGLMGLAGDDFVGAYRARLDRLDLTALVRRFDGIAASERGRRLVLLCFEDVWAGQACHRRVFAEWFEERTGQTVPEVEDPQLRLDVDQTAPRDGRLTEGTQR